MILSSRVIFTMWVVPQQISDNHLVRNSSRKGSARISSACFPTPCKNLTVDHSDYVSLLRKLRKIPGVKKVFIRSGVRFDYVVADRDKTFLRELVEHHVSGQLACGTGTCV